jgi:spore coat polysaccharide biosynthesis protein SpsF (cytidylyltransferase family)
MSTAKHTPGPLKAVQVIIENSPCTWAVHRKSIREQWGKPSIATYIDNEADARLFAAAPAMYEALQQIEVTWRHFRGCNLMEELPGLYVTIKQVLAQAEGK